MNQPILISRNLSFALGATLWLILTGVPLAHAQSQGSGTSGSDRATQNQDSKNAGEASKDSVATNDTKPSSQSAVTAIGTASVLGMPNGSLRWGDFFVSTFSFTQIHDHANYVDPAAPTAFSGSSFSSNTSLFQTNLVFNHSLRQGQIALQYEPRLAIINGNVYPDYSNQNLGFNVLLNPTARWSLGFHNTFTYFSSQNVFASYYVDANTQTGATVQNNFLDGPGSLLNEAVGLSAAYKLSPRTTIGFSPDFSYLRTTGRNLEALTGRDYAGGVTLGYQLSARQTVGTFFRVEYVTVTGTVGGTPIYSFGGSYARQMGPAWLVSAAFGATRNPVGGVFSPWTFSGTASIMRDFRRFSVGGVYTRDIAMGYVTNNFADRADGFFSWQVLRHVQWRTTLGSQIGDGADSSISAYYAVNEIHWRLAPRVASYVSYGYRLQNGDASRVLTGHRNFVSAGIRWEAVPPTLY